MNKRKYYNTQRKNKCDILGISKNDYNWYRRQGEKLRKIYEDDCNGYLTEKEYIIETSCIEIVVEIKSRDLGLYVYFQTDPRGATIYLSQERIEKSTYNQASCIY